MPALNVPAAELVGVGAIVRQVPPSDGRAALAMTILSYRLLRRLENTCVVSERMTRASFGRGHCSTHPLRVTKDRFQDNLLSVAGERNSNAKDSGVPHLPPDLQLRTEATDGLPDHVASDQA